MSQMGRQDLFHLSSVRQMHERIHTQVAGCRCRVRVHVGVR